MSSAMRLSMSPSCPSAFNGSAMISRMVMRGSSELIGSWKTIWMLRRSARRSAFVSAEVSVPVTTTVLPSGGSRFMTSSRVVVLPEPDSPTMAKHSPWRTAKLTPFTAWTVPTRRLRMDPFTSGKSLTRLSTLSEMSRWFMGVPASTSSAISGSGYRSRPAIRRSRISPARTQLAKCPASSGSSSRGGSRLRHLSMATGHLLTNGHSAETSMSRGGVPGMGTSGLSVG